VAQRSWRTQLLAVVTRTLSPTARRPRGWVGTALTPKHGSKRETGSDRRNLEMTLYGVEPC
jgi:hypothetical protein